MSDAKKSPQPEFKTYQLTERHYRQGVMYSPGELITIPSTEKPGRTWVEVKEAPAPKVMVPVDGRPSDKAI